VRAALSVSGDEASVRKHVHAFHSYPARLHPQTAEHLIAGLTQPGDTVFDPFCGSGTVLLEAILQGRAAVGTDLNPLSVALTNLKTRGPKTAERAHWLETAEQVAEFAVERRMDKAPPLKRYPAQERQLFDPHMLLELDSLSAGVAQVEANRTQAALRLVLSSIVTKVSRRPGDSSGKVVPKRLAGGFAIRMFVARTRELCAQFDELERLLPAPPKSQAFEADARELKPIKPKSVDLIVCSPPYPGVYDYYEHHRVRLGFAGLSAGRFQQGEIGSRRQLTALAGAAARATWEKDLTQVLAACAKVLKPGKLMCCVLGDVALPGVTVRGDVSVKSIAGRAGMEVVAVGSQERPVFHRNTEEGYQQRSRAEHLVVLRRSA
jgi:DNA modification methylase